jgi:hypothetical protein
MNSTEDWEEAAFLWNSTGETENRKNHHESIMNWGRTVMGNREGIKKIYFVKVEE